MANGPKFDTRGWDAAFNMLEGPAKESLARRMCVEGGRVLRDQARENATRAELIYNPTSRGSQRAGTLGDHIYVAYNSQLSGSNSFTYSVSWNKRVAFWGTMVEFGRYIRYAYFKDKDGVYHTLSKKNPANKLAQPIRIPARPFLGPAMDMALPTLSRVMALAAQRELPLILKGQSSDV